LQSFAGNPGLVHRSVIDQLFRPKPDLDFEGGVLEAVAAVYQIILDTESEIAANRAGRRLRAVGDTHQVTRHGHGLAAFPHHSHGRPSRNELHERFVEGLSLVYRVVFLCQVSTRTHQFHGGEAQALLLESLDELAYQAPLKAVWL